MWNSETESGGKNPSMTVAKCVHHEATSGEVQLTDQDVAWVDKENARSSRKAVKRSPGRNKQNDRYRYSLIDWLVCRQAVLQGPGLSV